MANIPDTSLHNFTTGETVTDVTLDQNTQVIQQAVNDNDSRIKILENAQAGAMTGVRSGTAFPTLPVPKSGDLFFRTDLDKLYVYVDDTIQWNDDPSKIKTALGLGVTSNSNTISTGDLNNYKTSGNYFVTAAVTNVPVTGYTGYLMVYVGADTSKAFQVFIHDSDGKTYRRYLSGGTWSTWAKIATDLGVLFGGTGISSLSAVSQSYGSGKQLLQSTALVSEYDNTVWSYTDAFHYNILKGGLFMIDLDVTRSDLPANQQWTIGVEVNNDANKDHCIQMIMGQYGWNQTTVNNSRIPFHFSRVIRMNAGDFFHFFMNSDDGPRSYWYWFRVVRIGD